LITNHDRRQSVGVFLKADMFGDLGGPHQAFANIGALQTISGVANPATGAKVGDAVVAGLRVNLTF
jgi:hypothetical protein